ncbi:MAG: hypothetical protein H7A21_03405 [Spirochaetales bacterium]|nr:hypothetical protein [Leptospiraceae bacterium]MCP5480456.1 hypothetical protein [Spirochaetales bacterium]
MDDVLANWKMKVLALAAAIGLTLYVQYSQTITRVIQVRVERPELPENLILATRVPSFMEVTLNGPEKLLDFEASEFRIVLSTPAPEPGSKDLQAFLFPELPDGISAEYRRLIPVEIARLMRRELPVVPELDPRLEEGVSLGYVYATPATVTVDGPAEVVGRMEAVTTRTREVRAEMSGVDVGLNELPDFVRLAPGQDITVKLDVRVIATGDELRRIERVPVRCTNAIPGLVLRVPGGDTVDVDISSTGDQGVTRDQLRAEVFCPVFLTDDGVRPRGEVPDQPVTVRPPPGLTSVRVMRVHPPRLTLQFARAPRIGSRDQQEGLADHLRPP